MAGACSSARDRVVLLQLPTQCIQRVAEPRSGRAVRYAELAGDRREGPPVIEGLYEHGPVRGRQMLEGCGNELPIEDMLQQNRST